MIKCTNVSKIYNQGTSAEFQAIKNISFKIKEGEFAAIVGASGSGKSTLLHLIGCLDKPTKGKIFLDSMDVSELNENQLAEIRREKIGFVFQFFFLFPTLTALENIMLPMFFSKKTKNKKEKARQLLKEIGLSRFSSHYPSELSGGQRQRIAIARALANDPEIILADEPTGNLDSKAGKEILNLLIRLNREKGKTLVIVSHDKYVASKAKRILFLKDGKIIKEVKK